MVPVHRQINRHASRLRRDATEVERLLWSDLRNRQIGGYKFRRQWTVGPYVADFACLELMLVVELDGGQHSPEADEPRTRFLEASGYAVLRFWNNEVIDHRDGVLKTILGAAIGRDVQKKTLTQPSPAKAGEG